MPREHKAQHPGEPPYTLGRERGGRLWNRGLMRVDQATIEPGGYQEGGPSGDGVTPVAGALAEVRKQIRQQVEVDEEPRQPAAQGQCRHGRRLPGIRRGLSAALGHALSVLRMFPLCGCSRSPARRSSVKVRLSRHDWQLVRWGCPRPTRPPASGVRRARGRSRAAGLMPLRWRQPMSLKNGGKPVGHIPYLHPVLQVFDVH